MSQAIFADINPAATSGSQLATLLNSFRDALISSMSGTSRPTGLLAGGGWLDITDDPTSWTFKIWTGTVDISIFTVNLSTGLGSAPGADTEFDITKVVASAVGPILKLIKKRVASSGQVVSGDTIGEIQWVGTTNTPTSPVVCRIRALASDTMTSSANGGYIVFEGTTATSTSMLEQMRLKDGFLGVGTQAADSVIAPPSGT